MRKLTILATVVLTLAGTTASAQTRLGLRPSAQDNTPVNPSQFTVARLHYPGGGDWYWGTSALPNLLKFLEDEVGIPVSTAEVRVKPSDDNLFDYPFIYSTGHGNMRFSDEDIVRLRNYLTGGGFWLINDSYGMDKSVRREIRRIFPDRELVELPFSHAIYHEPYEFPDGPPKIHEHDGKPAQGYAILDQDRVMVYYVVECDIGDGWEDPQVHKDPPQKRQAALRMGANIAVYALTR
jgi:hypothetical protein